MRWGRERVRHTVTVVAAVLSIAYWPAPSRALRSSACHLRSTTLFCGGEVMSNVIPNSVAEEARELRKQWVWLLALGIGHVLIGGVAIAVPFPATVGVVAVIGIAMLAAGIAQIVGAFSSARWSGVFVHIMVGVLYGVTGFFVLEN